MKLKQTKKFFIFDIENTYNNGYQCNSTVTVTQSAMVNTILSTPGFGWTVPLSHQVKVHTKNILIDDNYDNCNDIFLSTIPGEFIINELPNSNDIINPLLFGQAIKNVLEDYFYIKYPQYKDDLIEFYKTKKSNNRILQWNLMNIASNTSFKLHAHQNIELIYVIKGTIHELRLINDMNNTAMSLPRYYDVNDKYGPNLNNINELLHFEHRFTTAMNNNNNDNIQDIVDSYDCYMNSFLINERGSIHLSYTMDDGAILLVLWSGSHGNIPLDQYPNNSEHILKLPKQVIPLSS